MENKERINKEASFCNFRINIYRVEEHLAPTA
jgi:hypothetical protein